MMKAACFIPIKERSTRVPRKNFRLLAGIPLYQHIISNAIAADCFNKVYIDTDSSEIKEYCNKLPLDTQITVIDRDPELAKDTANGNDLLNKWCQSYPDYDLYFQLFATAPFLSSTTIKECVKVLLEHKEYDSVFTAYEHCGWYWFDDEPINYEPCELPRSQDAKKVFSETTGLYGIKKEIVSNLGCRIGQWPYVYYVNEIEAVDIDSEFDFQIADFIADNYNVKL